MPAGDPEKIARRRETIRRMWPTGASMDQIAQVCGEPLATIATTITRMRRAGEDLPRRNGDQPYDTASPQRDQIVTMWREGRTVPEIAEAMALDRFVVTARLSEARSIGLSVPRRNQHAATPLTFESRTIIELWQAGVRAKEIGERLGLSPDAVQLRVRRLRRQGHDLATRRRDTRTAVPPSPPEVAPRGRASSRDEALDLVRARHQRRQAERAARRDGAL